jgi:hypothetical protein
VPKGTELYNAASWAGSAYVVNGIGNNRFGSTNAITRAELMTIFYRYGQYKELYVSAKGDLTKFNDAYKIPLWAKSAVEWAVGQQIVNGKAGLIDPQGAMTRAELSAILERFCKAYG